MSHLSQNVFQIAQRFSLDPMHLVLIILERYNPRISEILSAQWSNFYPKTYLILSGVKKSQNVIIRSPDILDAINKLPRVDSVKIFPYLTYSKVYHFIKANYSHLFNRFKKKKNCKVTHGYRYLNVEKISNDKVIRDILHHRSLRSGVYYKQNKEVSNGTTKKIQNRF